MKTTEQKVSDTLLQRGDLIKVGRHKYRCPKPSMATLIELSAIISKMPRASMDINDIMQEVLRHGKDCQPAVEAIALLLTGARRTSSFVSRWVNSIRRKRIAGVIAHDLTPSEAQQLATMLLSRSDVTSFFALTAFLCEVNITKPTKAETTAHGRQ